MFSRRDIICVFDGSFEGFLNIVYSYYYEKLNPFNIVEDGEYQIELGFQYINIDTDESRGKKVFDALNNKLQETSIDNITKAFFSDDKSRFINIFKYIILGFKRGREVDNCLNIDYVLKVSKLSNKVSREVHLLTGFLRFVETNDRIFYSAIEPENNVTYFLGEFFKDRLKDENFIIHDKKRGIASIYNGETLITREAPNYAKVQYSGNEKEYQAMWTTFFNSISIKERENKKLQRMHIPKKYRKNITEFNNIAIFD